MKILITTDPYTPQISGIVTSIICLKNELTRMGNEVRLLTLSHSDRTYKKGNEYFISSFHVPIYPEMQYTFNYKNSLMDELIEWKPDIIHIETEFSTMILGRIIASKTGAPYIMHCHTIYSDFFYTLCHSHWFSRFFTDKYINFRYDKAHLLVVPSEKMKRIMEDYKVRCPITVQPSGIDTEKFSQEISEQEKNNLKKKYGLKKYVLISTARLSKEKNLKELILYTKKLLTYTSDISLLLVGDGPYGKGLRKLVKKLGLEKHISFTGMIAPEKVYKYYQISDIYVSSSRFESQGLTCIEAMTASLPLVCRSDSSLKNILVNGRNGFTYRSDYQFVSSILKLINDDDLYKKMSDCSKSISKKYNKEDYAKRFLNLYTHVIEDNDRTDTNNINIDMLSMADSVDGQGVGSAYNELIRLLQIYGKNDFRVLINKSTRRADIIHIHTIEPVSFIRSKFTKKPVLMYVHFLPDTLDGSIRLPGFIFYIFKKYVIHFYRCADKLIVVNPAFIDGLEKAGIDRTKIKYIPNLVSHKDFYRMDSLRRKKLRQLLYRKYRIPEDAFLVMGCGQVQNRKGITDFIRVAEKLPDIHFIWVGGFSFGRITDGYRELKPIMKNPPRNVIFTGIVPRTRMNYFYNACDLLFVPSYNELFPMTILEAANTGTPMLLRDLELYKPILYDKYLKGKSNDEFAEIIEAVQADQSLYNKFSTASEWISDKYNEEGIYAMWRDFYQSCLFE